MAHFGLQVQFHITILTLHQMLKESCGTLPGRVFQEWLCVFRFRDVTVTPQQQRGNRRQTCKTISLKNVTSTRAAACLLANASAVQHLYPSSNSERGHMFPGNTANITHLQWNSSDVITSKPQTLSVGVSHFCHVMTMVRKRHMVLL